VHEMCTSGALRVHASPTSGSGRSDGLHLCEVPGRGHGSGKSLTGVV